MNRNNSNSNNNINNNNRSDQLSNSSVGGLTAGLIACCLVQVFVVFLHFINNDNNEDDASSDRSEMSDNFSTFIKGFLLLCACRIVTMIHHYPDLGSSLGSIFCDQNKIKSDQKKNDKQQSMGNFYRRHSDNDGNRIGVNKDSIIWKIGFTFFDSNHSFNSLSIVFHFVIVAT